MRRILRDTCIFAALMILTVFAFSISGVGLTEEIKLVFQLFGLAFILSVTNYIFDEITSLPILAGYIVKYFVVVGIVIVFGFIAGWFYPSNFWMAFIYVGVITVIVYALDSVKTEKDIEEINEMVKLSKNEKTGYMPLQKRKGWKVLLILIAAMTVLSIASIAGYFYFEEIDSALRRQHEDEARAAGFDKVYILCVKNDNVIIDGKLYECYRTSEIMFAGNLSSREIELYFESGTPYIDGAEGEESNLRIYCKSIGQDYEDKRFIEPYSIYNAGKKYGDYCLNGFAVSLPAVLFLIIVLIIYFSVYYIRRRQKMKRLP
ncbi:MAG: DUF3021 family protein [Saccharofermentans sp.]|nr:DUF3021 family protein [Saccharofermentans sp.]